MGRSWSEYIIRAINRSRAMVLILSGESNRSDQVLREVERAVHKQIPIFPLRVEDVRLSESMEYYISSVQRLDALIPPLHDHFVNVSRQLQELLNELRQFDGNDRPGPEPCRCSIHRIPSISKILTKIRSVNRSSLILPVSRIPTVHTPTSSIHTTSTQSRPA